MHQLEKGVAFLALIITKENKLAQICKKKAIKKKTNKKSKGGEIATLFVLQPNSILVFPNIIGFIISMGEKRLELQLE